MNAPLIVERTCNAPAARVWQAITDNSAMKSWYFDLAEFRPEPGFRFEFTAGEADRQYLHQCRVTEAVPEQKLSYTWCYEGLPGSPEVRFELFAEGETTRVKLTHTGPESFPDKESPDFAVASFSEGRNYIPGKSLKDYLEDAA